MLNESRRTSGSLRLAWKKVQVLISRETFYEGKLSNRFIDNAMWEDHKMFWSCCNKKTIDPNDATNSFKCCAWRWLRVGRTWNTMSNKINGTCTHFATAFHSRRKLIFNLRREFHEGETWKSRSLFKISLNQIARESCKQKVFGFPFFTGRPRCDLKSELRSEKLENRRG